MYEPILDEGAVLIETLSNIPVGSEIRDLERQLLTISRTLPKDSIFRKYLSPHRQYDYIPKLGGVLTSLRFLSELLINRGVDMNRDKITQGFHKYAEWNRRAFSEAQRKELEEVASRLEYG